ncbi:MAG: glycosyltransferase 87 family protein [Chthoniobacterales bacterium]
MAGALYVAVLLAYIAVPIGNAVLGLSIKDYELWHDIGQQVLHGEPIYPERFHKFPFMYPPTAAVFLAPISLLGKTGVVITLLLVNTAAWIACILLAVRLAAGSWQRQHLLVYFVPNALIAVYAWSNFHLGQPSLLLLALLLGGFVALQQKRQVLAGSLLALAASIKAFPVVVLVYLVYRRYWVATAALLLALAFLLVALPAPFRGLTQAKDDLQRWTEGMLLKYDDKGLAQRPGRSNSWKNQSFFGVANRTLRHIDADEQFGPHRPVYANFADLSFQAVNAIIAGLGVALGLVYLGVIPRRNRRTPETDAIEFALFILLLLMFTPLAFGYLFACLLYPFAVVVQRLLTRPTRRMLICGSLAVFLLALTLPLQRGAQTYGNTFLATLVLFIGLALELWERKRAPVAA